MRRANRDEINGELVDRYTLLHLAAGAAAERLGISAGAALTLQALWELVEPQAKKRLRSVFPRPLEDQTRNKITDTLALAAGWWIGRALWRATR